MLDEKEVVRLKAGKVRKSDCHFSPKTRNVKLVLEYDGTRYFGFQKQPGRLTIQEALERAMGKLFNHPQKIASASGRTDTGVHATHHVVNFKTTSQIPLYKIQRGLNFYLPDDISVMKIEEVSKGFHARFKARSKVYEYRVWNGEVRSPLNAHSSYHVVERLDIKKMREGARILTGRHDFRSFCSQFDKNEDSDSVGKKKKDTVRTIKSFQLVRAGHLIRFRVEADGFLYHMVRNLVGTLIDLGRGKSTLPNLRYPESEGQGQGGDESSCMRPYLN